MKNQQIPKRLHFVWIGDESRCPHICIDSWREKNPEYEVKIWGNSELENRKWQLKEQMERIYQTGQLYGVADLMRWEILNDIGGIALDADSLCINPIPDWLLSCNSFACWQNEFSRPGLISNGYVGAPKGDFLIKEILRRLSEETDLAYKTKWFGLKKKKRTSWKTTGPQIISDCYFDMRYSALTVLPSHFFIPEDQLGNRYSGTGPVIAKQLFGSTRNGHISYQELQDLSQEQLLQELNND